MPTTDYKTKLVSFWIQTVALGICFVTVNGITLLHFCQIPWAKYLGWGCNTVGAWFWGKESLEAWAWQQRPTYLPTYLLSSLIPIIHTTCLSTVYTLRETKMKSDWSNNVELQVTQLIITLYSTRVLYVKTLNMY